MCLTPAPPGEPIVWLLGRAVARRRQEAETTSQVASHLTRPALSMSRMPEPMRAAQQLAAHPDGRRGLLEILARPVETQGEKSQARATEKAEG